MRAKKFAKVACFLLASGATTVALLITIVNFAGRQELEKTKQELFARGEKLSLAEMEPSPISDEQNFFAAPVWRQFIEFARPEQIGINPFASLFDYRNGGRDLFDLSHLGSFPSQRPSDLRAMAGSIQVWQGIDQPRAPHPPATDQEAAAIILDTMTHRAAVLQDIEQAAQRPFARWPFRSDHPMAAQYFAPMFKLARMLSLRASTRMENGQREEAAADISLIMHLANDLEPEPSLLAAMIRVSLRGIAVSAFWDCTARGSWTEEELRRLQANFAATDWSAEFVRSIRAERGLLNDWFSHRRGSGPQEAERARTDPRDTQHPLARVPLSWFPEGPFLLDLATANRQLQSVIDAAQRRDLPALSELRAAKPRFNGYLLLPGLDPILRAQPLFLEEAQQLNLARTACALERYRLAKGIFPPSLEALVPAYLAEIPSNLLQPEPIRYERLGNENFRLTTTAARPREGEPENGNLVWQRNR